MQQISVCYLALSLIIDLEVFDWAKVDLAVDNFDIAHGDEKATITIIYP